MIKDHELYDLTQVTQGAIFQAGFTAYLNSVSEADRPSPPIILQLRRGYAESPAWVMAQAQEFDPEPLTVEKFRRRAVYSAPGLVQALLELLASEKWFDRIEDKYRLTDAGGDMIRQRVENRTKPFLSYEPIPRAEIERLENLLARVVDASMESDDPPGTWCLAHSRRRAPADDMPPLVKIIHHFSDLNAFRDDAHMAAYGQHDVAGHTWEAFSYVREGKATTAEALFDQLAYRGFSRTDWSESLRDLVGRGWLTARDGLPQITDAGQAIHKAAEQQTDAYFYAPWDCLGDSEFDELCALMQKIRAVCMRSLQTE